MTAKIVTAIDGSNSSWKALDMATDMAKAQGAELIVVHVVPYEPMPDELKEFARVEHVPVDDEEARFHQARTLGDALTRSAERRVHQRGYDKVATKVVEGPPAEGIVAAAREAEADVVVVGSRGLSDAKGLLLGSVSHKVAHLSPCTCVTVK